MQFFRLISARHAQDLNELICTSDIQSVTDWVNSLSLYFGVMLARGFAACYRAPTAGYSIFVKNVFHLNMLLSTGNY